MTRSAGLRQYRACVRCRSRKTRCDLQTIGEPGKPPCLKCEREGADCVLADSRRGGDYSRFRQPRKAYNPDSRARQHSEGVHHFEKGVSKTSPGNVSVPSTHHSDCPLHENLQNPSDALLILAHAAGEPRERAQCDGSIEYQGRRETRGAIRSSEQGVFSGREHRSGSTYFGSPLYSLAQFDHRATYPPLRDGIISIEIIAALIQLYHENYHQFFPIVHKDFLDSTHIQKIIQNEPFLMTSILIIASKDRLDLARTHKGLWDYLRQKILDVVLGAASTRQVGCVEGLLLLGEWNLINHGQMDDGGGEAAWSILGLAVRLAYRLRLEDSFRSDGTELDHNAERNRLAWTFTYLSDRQISIRMGQAFWCRGPGLAVPVTAEDFPSLRYQSPEDEDLATWIQAQVELTTLFGNAHDILFPSKARTVELIMRGDYVKYIDDTTRALSAWQYKWRDVAAPKHLRSCLTLMQEYLRLYVSAFAFQAVLYRTSQLAPEKNLHGEQHTLDFPDSTMASPDARYIYDALDAAESLLTIFIEDFNPEKHLRYLPARFYLYEIHSSVFLFKAHASGAIPPARHPQKTALITRFLSHLQSITPDESHISTRYSRLLQRLWFRSEQSAPESSDAINDPNASLNSGLCPDSGTSDINGNYNVNTGLSTGSAFGIGGGNLLDDVSLGSLDDLTLDGFLAMPPVFPYDFSVLFNGE